MVGRPAVDALAHPLKAALAHPPKAALAHPLKADALAHPLKAALAHPPKAPRRCGPGSGALKEGVGGPGPCDALERLGFRV